LTWKVEEQVQLSYLYYSGYNGTDQKDPQVEILTVDTKMFLHLHSRHHTLNLNLSLISVAECWGLYLPSKWHISYKPWKTGLDAFWNIINILTNNSDYNVHLKIKLLDFQAPVTVLHGPIIDEVHQQINPWIYQVLYLFKLQDFHF
jgi:hypothetical protein